MSVQSPHTFLYKTQDGRTVVVGSPQTLRGYRMESIGHLTDALVTFGLRVAFDDRTMPIFAFSCGLPRVILRCPYDSTTSCDLRSLYDFVIVCTITNFKNRKTVARRHAVRHHTGAVRRPCDDRAVTSRFLYDTLGILWGQNGTAIEGVRKGSCLVGYICPDLCTIFRSAIFLTIFWTS